VKALDRRGRSAGYEADGTLRELNIGELKHW
jgi:hypothetical protein